MPTIKTVPITFSAIVNELYVVEKRVVTRFKAAIHSLSIVLASISSEI